MLYFLFLLTALLVYFISILDYRNAWQKANSSNFLFFWIFLLFQAIFLFEFKTGCKAAETTRNINTSGLGTANECRVQWGSGSFAKETRALKMRKVVASHWKLTTTIESHDQSWPSYEKNSMSTILWSLGIWSKLERLKRSVSASWADQK